MATRKKTLFDPKSLNYHVFGGEPFVVSRGGSTLVFQVTAGWRHLRITLEALTDDQAQLSASLEPPDSGEEIKSQSIRLADGSPDMFVPESLGGRLNFGETTSGGPLPTPEFGTYTLRIFDNRGLNQTTKIRIKIELATSFDSLPPPPVRR